MPATPTATIDYKSPLDQLVGMLIQQQQNGSGSLSQNTQQMINNLVSSLTNGSTTGTTDQTGSTGTTGNTNSNSNTTSGSTTTNTADLGALQQAFQTAQAGMTPDQLQSIISSIFTEGAKQVPGLVGAYANSTGSRATGNSATTLALDELNKSLSTAAAQSLLNYNTSAQQTATNAAGQIAANTRDTTTNQNQNQQQAQQQQQVQQTQQNTQQAQQQQTQQTQQQNQTQTGATQQNTSQQQTTQQNPNYQNLLLALGGALGKNLLGSEAVKKAAGGLFGNTSNGVGSTATAGAGSAGLMSSPSFGGGMPSVFGGTQAAYSSAAPAIGTTSLAGPIAPGAGYTMGAAPSGSLVNQYLGEYGGTVGGATSFTAPSGGFNSGMGGMGSAPQLGTTVGGTNYTPGYSSTGGGLSISGLGGSSAGLDSSLGYGGGYGSAGGITGAMGGDALGYGLSGLSGLGSGFLSGGVDLGSNAAAAIGSNPYDFTSSIGSGGGGIDFSGIGGGIGDFFGGVGNAVGGIASGIGDWLGSFFANGGMPGGPTARRMNYADGGGIGAPGDMRYRGASAPVPLQQGNPLQQMMPNNIFGRTQMAREVGAGLQSPQIPMQMQQGTNNMASGPTGTPVNLQSIMQLLPFLLQQGAGMNPTGYADGGEIRNRNYLGPQQPRQQSGALNYTGYDNPEMANFILQGNNAAEYIDPAQRAAEEAAARAEAQRIAQQQQEAARQQAAYEQQQMLMQQQQMQQQTAQGQQQQQQPMTQQQWDQLMLSGRQAQGQFAAPGGGNTYGPAPNQGTPAFRPTSITQLNADQLSQYYSAQAQAAEAAGRPDLAAGYRMNAAMAAGGYWGAGQTNVGIGGGGAGGSGGVGEGGSPNSDSVSEGVAGNSGGVAPGIGTAASAVGSAVGAPAGLAVSAMDAIGQAVGSANAGGVGSPGSAGNSGATAASADGSPSGGGAEGSGGSGGGGGGSKIICTAMNETYGLEPVMNRTWVRYSQLHMQPAHQVGYHKVFLPLVKYGFKQGDGYWNLKVRKVLEWIAINRTKDIQNELAGVRRNLLHRSLRAVAEPLLLLIGKLS